MSNLIDLQSQIEKLQKQADQIKSKEFDKTVQEVIAKMRAFGITVKDLQSAGSRRTKGADINAPKSPPRAKVAGAKAKAPNAGAVAAKYRGPNGETWSGRGLTPRWLTALLSEGKAKEDFVIKP